MMDNQKFIQQNGHKLINEIALLLSKKPDLDKDFILNQINGLQKAKNKLPEFYQHKNMLYPSTLSMEQCSSEETAIFKSNIIKGKSVIDLTGGFGVDSYYFSKIFNEVIYVEKDTALFNIAIKNFNILSAKIKSFNTSTEDFIAKPKQKADLIYIDPSRRNQNKKVYQLEDCSPNILTLTEKLFEISPQILVKTSPLLDLKQSIKELKNVAKIFVVALNNDCKEVLYLLSKNNPKTIEINAINLSKKTQSFHYNLEEEQQAKVILSEPLQYLYEPNVAILKAGAFKSVALKFKLCKLAKNSHLYTSDKLEPHFCGRIFKVKKVLKYNAKDFKLLGISQANVSCRNFKDSVVVVKKKLKLKDGGKNYLFATTNLHEKPILILCVKD